MAIANYTTKVDEFTTLGQIQGILAKHGARNISVDFEDGRPVSLSFVTQVGQTLLPFRLPSKWEGLLRAMQRDSDVPNRFCKEEQARRVAWRITHDWVRAQTSLIEADMASLPEVFFPYAVGYDGRTLYETAAQTEFNALAPAKD